MPLNDNGYKNTWRYKVSSKGHITVFATIISINANEDLFRCTVKTYIGKECNAFDITTTKDWLESNTYETLEQASKLWVEEYNRRIEENQRSIDDINQSIKDYNDQY